MPGTSEMQLSASKQLALLGHAQLLCNMGCWQWIPASGGFFWTDTLFAIFSLPVLTDNFITIAEVNKRVHPADLPVVQKYWEELRAGKQVDFYFKIVTADDETRHLRFVGETVSGEGGEKLTQGCCIDVTQEWEANYFLKEYAADLEFQLKAFHRSEQVGLSGTWQVNLDTHQAWYSDNIYRLYGLMPQALTAHLDTFTGFIHTDDREAVISASDVAFKHRVPLHLEYRITRHDGAIRYLRVVSDITKGIDGQEFLTGITQDITEQKQLETELRESNEALDIQNQHFRHTEQIASIGTWQVNMETRIAYYSDNLYRLYGLKPGAGSNPDHFLQLVYSEDKPVVEEASRKAFEELQLPNINFRIIRQDGKLRFFSQTAKLVKNAEGEQVMIGVVQDMTKEQVLAAQLQELNRELKIQNETFTQAEHTASIGTWRWNLDTNAIFYSDNIYRIYGLKPQSVRPGYESFHKYFHPDDLQQLKDVPLIMQKTLGPVQVDYRIYRADGELRYIRGRNRLHVSDTGERILIGTTQDITDEMLLKEKLNEQVRFIKLLTDNLVDQVVVTNTSNIIVEFNKAAETMQQVGKEDVLGKNFFEAFPQSKKSNIVDNLKRALKGEMVHETNIPSSLAKGYVERFHIPVKADDGKVMGVLNVIRDITEEYQLKQQLQNRLGFIESLVDASVTRLIAFDKELNYTLWNKQCEVFYGRAKESVLGKNILEFYPKLKKEPFYADLRRCLQGETVYIPPKETIEEGYHESNLVPLKDDGGQVNGVLRIIHDLSERREAERRAEESRNLLLQTAEATPDAITIYDLESKQPLYLNDALAKWIGVSSARLTEMGVEGRMLLIHPEDKDRLEEFNGLLDHTPDDEIKTIEYRVLTKQKNYLWIRNRSKVFARDASGKVTRILSVLQDITSQRAAEQQVKAHAHYLQRITETTPDMISIMELGTRKFTFLNSDTFRSHGFDPDDIAGKSAGKDYRIVHPDDRNALDEYFKKFTTASDKEIIGAEYRARTLQGEWKWFSVKGKVFQRDANDTATHILNVIEDITARKNAEQQVFRLKDELAQKASDKLKEKNKELEDATRGWQGILNAIPHYVWTSLPNGLQIFHNAHWIKESGIDPNTNPDAWQALIHPDDLERTLRLWNQAITSGTEYYNEVRIKNVEGQYRWHIARGVPMKDSQGKIKVWIGTSTDIHELKCAEEKLHRK